MRWNARSLLVVTTLTLALTGCGMFGKKSQPAAVNTDPVYNYEPPVTSAEPAYAEVDTYDEPLATTRLSGSYDSYPVATPDTDPRYHTVVKRDTLYSLARRYYGNQAKWKEIYNANSDQIADPNMIKVGQRLIIP